MLRWSLTERKHVERTRDRIFRGVGSEETLIPVNDHEMAARLAIIGLQPISAQWRKPLSIMEINRMAPTAEVRERKGRP